VFSEIINPRLTEIFKLVGAELRKSGFGRSLPSGIVVTGGTAETIGLDSVAKTTLNLPFRVGMPMGVSGLIEEIEGPAFATVVGLVHYGVNVKPTSRSFGGVGPGNIGGAAKKTVNWLKSFLP